MFQGKRELLARALYWSGAASLLHHLPGRSVLLVLTYHRIGDAGTDLFDPALFSATGEEFDEQISFLKRRLTVTTLEEALAFVDGTLKEQTPGCRVLITFDDGYLDNYQVAFPILRSHGVQGVFFLATSIVGSSCVPWWDHVAYLLRTARQRRFSLRYPARLDVDLDGNGLARSLRNVLSLYKRPDNTEPESFIQQLQECTGGNGLPAEMRRFLGWEEAREMIAGGMAVGSHTHTHSVLTQLTPERQRSELSQSRSVLKEQLGIGADVLAYPVGGRSCFSTQTQELAREAGYRAAFSFYGGTNLPGMTRPYDIRRVGVDGQSRSRFRVQSAVCGFTGKYWP